MGSPLAVNAEGDLDTSRRPTLIVVSGRAATGKTTFARTLSESSGMPLFAKDDFKELLHDALGVEDRETSRALGRASYSSLRHIAETMLASGLSLILESNFDAADSGLWLRQLEERYSPFTIHVLLRANPDVIIHRYRERSQHRHPAHFDDIAIEELRLQLLESDEPLDVMGRTLEFDTTDFSRFDSNDAIQQVTALLPDKS